METIKPQIIMDIHLVITDPLIMEEEVVLTMAIMGIMDMTEAMEGTMIMDVMEGIIQDVEGMEVMVEVVMVVEEMAVEEMAVVVAEEEDVEAVGEID